METSSINRPLKHWDCTVQRHVYSAAQQRTSKADGPPLGADISGKPRDKTQKTEGKDVPNAAHFNNAKKSIQQASSSGTPTLSANKSKPVEVVGLQSMRSKLAIAVNRKLNWGRSD
jgi:hypothetical protein